MSGWLGIDVDGSNLVLLMILRRYSLALSLDVLHRRLGSRCRLELPFFLRVLRDVVVVAYLLTIRNYLLRLLRRTFFGCSEKRSVG